MFSIKRREKVKMNFEGSPQCGNAGDMKFDVTVEGFGANLDSDGFVFDSVNLFELFNVIQRGRWSGSCEGIGIFCAHWLMAKDSGVEWVVTTIVTERGNQLTITIDRSEFKEKIFSAFSIKQL